MFYGLAAKIVGIIATVVLIFGLGYSQAWRSAQVRIGELQGAIQAANAQSAKVLAEKTQQVAEATAKAKILNNELEASREAAFNTINNYHEQLATARLRDPHGNQSGCTNALPVHTDTGIGTTDAANGAYLSEELDRLLRRESARADQCAIDKNLLLDLVKHNCGIVK